MALPVFVATPTLAPKLHRIRIEKFRRIREVLELDLRTPRGRPSSLAVLAGPNGCGKTSVLEAVLLGLGQEALIARDLDERDRESSWRLSIPEGARINLTVSLDDGPEERWVRSSVDFFREKPGGAEETFVSDAPRERPRLRVEYFSSWRAPELVGAVKPLSLRARGAWSRRMNNEASRLYSLKQQIAVEFMRFGLQRSLLESTSHSPEVWMDRLNRAWRRFHRNDGTEIVPGLVEREGEGEFFDLFVQKGKDRICSVDQLSSGEIENPRLRAVGHPQRRQRRPARDR